MPNKIRVYKRFDEIGTWQYNIFLSVPMQGWTKVDTLQDKTQLGIHVKFWEEIATDLNGKVIYETKATIES